MKPSEVDDSDLGFELYHATASTILPLLKRGTLTAEKYVCSLLARIQQRDENVQAWAYLDADYAIREAKMLDQIPEEQRGPLHGIPIAVKDMINTKDLPTQHGSLSYLDNHPGVDATSVAILRAAGALIIGKTTTAEFAATNKGPKTCNPHDPSRTPGGSSSGSAAAIADFQVPIAIGTQTGGSMVRPASYCGIYGMKPTWGAISTEGQKVVSISLDTLGFFARSVEDLELLAGVYNLADDEYEQGEESLKIEDCKVGILKTGVWPKAGPGTRAAIQSAVAILNKHGATVTEVELPDDFNAIPDYHSLIVAGEARASFLGEYKMHRQHLDGKLTGHVENASKTSWKDHLHAKDAVSALRPTFDSIAEGYSVILTPSVIDEAPLDLEYTGSPAFNCTWTTLHVPVINIPAFKGDHGMPIGVSLVGPRYRDRQLLRVARVISGCLMSEGEWKMGS